MDHRINNATEGRRFSQTFSNLRRATKEFREKRSLEKLSERKKLEYDQKYEDALVKIFKESYKFRVMQVYALKTILVLLTISSLASGIFFGTIQYKKLFYLLFIITICSAIFLLIVFKKFSYEPTLYKKFIDKDKEKCTHLEPIMNYHSNQINENSTHNEQYPGYDIAVQDYPDCELIPTVHQDGTIKLTIKDENDEITISKTPFQFTNCLAKYGIKDFTLK